MKKVLLIAALLFTCFSSIFAATLTLDANGGTCTISSITESPATLPICTPPDGKRFLGWATTESATAADYEYPFGLSNYEFVADGTLYAVYGTIVEDNGWKKITSLDQIAPTTLNSYGPYFKLVVEDGTTNEDRQRYGVKRSGTSTTVEECKHANFSSTNISSLRLKLVDQTKSYYKIESNGYFYDHYNGWATSIGSGKDNYYNYTITFNNEKGYLTLTRVQQTSVFAYKETLNQYGTTVSNRSFGTVTNKECDQYANGGVTIASFHVKANKSSTISFTKCVAYVNVNNGNIYRAYFSPGDGGTGSIEYKEGAKKITLPTASDGISKTGYVLAGWQCSLDGETYAPGANYTPNGADVIFTAIWRTPKVTLDATKDGICNINELTEFPATLPTCRATRNRFIGWKQPNSDEILDAGTTFPMPAEDITLTAQYAAIGTGTVWEPITAENQLSGSIFAIEDGTEDVETRWALQVPSKKYAMNEGNINDIARFTSVPRIEDESTHPQEENKQLAEVIISNSYGSASGYITELYLDNSGTSLAWVKSSFSHYGLSFKIIDESKGLFEIIKQDYGKLCLVTNSSNSAQIQFSQEKPTTNQYDNGGKKISEYEDGTYLYVWRAYQDATYYKYQVTYTCDDSHVIPPEADIVSFKKVTLPTTISATSGQYTLLSWVDDFTGIKYQPGQTITPTTDMELRAVVIPAADITVKNWDAQGVWIEYTGTYPQVISEYEDDSEPTVNILSEHCKDQGLYHIAISYIQSHVGENVYLGFRNDAQSDIEQLNCLVVPNITSGTTTYTGTGIREDLPLYVQDKLTISGATLTVTDLTIQAGAQLVIEDGATLKVNTLTLLAGTYDDEGGYVFVYPQMEVNGTLNNTSNVINYDYLINTSQYYSLCLPYSVNQSDITYDNGGVAQFAIRYYDGAERAAGNSGWKGFSEDVLQAGVGYTIAAMPQKVGGKWQHFCRLRLPMHVDLSTENSEKTDKTVPIHIAEANRPSDHGWNLIGNPFLSTFTGIGGLSSENGIGLLEDGEWTNNVRYVVIPANDGKSYTSQEAAETDLPAFKCFFMQLGTGDELLFPFANRQAKAPKFLTAEQNSEIKFGLQVVNKDNAKLKDYLGIIIDNQYTTNYEINADLAKFQMNNGMNIYAVTNEANLAYLAVDEQNAQNIPIGYCTTTAGTYTISMDEKYKDCGLKEVNLFDTDEGTITNLLTNSYSFATSAQTNNNRFVLQCVPSNNAPTALGSSQNELLIYSEQGHLILLGNLNGHLSIYAIDGREVYNTTLNGSACKIPLPQGIYVIKTNQYQGKARVY